ncbi:hypothetical protein C1645_786580, partial [Glomus cerebriforme]
MIKKVIQQLSWKKHLIKAGLVISIPNSILFDKDLYGIKYLYELRSGYYNQYKDQSI